MLLTKSKSRCSEHQSRIVSEENRRRHCAVNKQSFCVRHYKLDGDIFKNETSCDYLVLNDCLKNAYFIELKGTDINHAAKQLNYSVEKLKNEISEYRIFLRIIASKVRRTHNIYGSEIRSLQKKYGNDLKIRSDQYEEDL